MAVDSKHLTKSITLVLFSLISASCNHRPSLAGTDINELPTDGQINDLESLARMNKCVGEISKWRRFYFFKKLTYWQPTEKDVVSFTFMRAKGDVIKAGIEKMEPGGLGKPDDVQVDIVKGDYSLPSRKLTVSYCGPNQKSM